MPNPGDILYYKDFQFDDGSSRNKLFVVLNVADVNSPCLLLKTTSNSERYGGVKEGCSILKRVFLIPSRWQEWFDVDTYVQLPQIFEISTVDLLQGTFSKMIKMEEKLSASCFTQLRNCLRQFKEDISPQHWKLIFSS